MKKKTKKQKRAKNPREFLEKELDGLVAELTWVRDNYTCQKCLRGPCKNAHHAFNRTYKGDGIRWDPRNLVNFCWPCHLYWAEVKHEEFRDWFIARIGEATWLELKRMALQGGKITPDALRQIKENLTAELNRLKKGSEYDGKLQ